MDEFSISDPANVNFSCRQSNSGAGVVWRVKDFSTLKEEPEPRRSPKFTFKEVEWDLLLYPFGDAGAAPGYISLFLKNSSSLPMEVKYQFIFKNESGKDFSSVVIKKDFSAVTIWGVPSLRQRKNLLDRKLGNFLPEDVLTIYCKMEVAEVVEKETATKTDSEKVSLKSEINFERALSNFREPFDSGRFSDVVLRVGEEAIPAHKLILSAHSDVFKAMFDSNMKESQDGAVDLFGMDSTAARAMLLYMYTREVQELSTENTLQLYVAADKYMLTELKEKCREFLSKNMSAKDVGEVFEVASLHGDTILAKAAHNFFAANVRSILKAEEWKEFSAKKLSVSVELLTYVITSNDLF